MFYVPDPYVVPAEHSKHVEVSHAERILYTFASQEWLNARLTGVLRSRRCLINEGAAGRVQYHT